MSAGVPTRGRRRGLRLCLWLIPVWLPVLVVLLAFSWLSSPLGRSWVESRIRGITGLDARVGAVRVSPWSGISLRKVELLQPPQLRPLLKSPLFSVAEIRITPVWKSWLRGRRELRTIELDNPRAFVALEMLGSLAGSRGNGVSTTPPVAGPVVVVPPATSGPAPPVPPATAPQQAREPAVPPGPVLPPTAWIHLNNASLVVVSASSGADRLKIDGIQASIPVAGKAAGSQMNIASVEISGRRAMDGFSAMLDWRAPVLSMPLADATIFGVKTGIAGKTALASGLPVQLELRIPQQKPAGIDLGDDASADPGTVAANGRFMGLLLSPSTWQGELVAESINPSARMDGRQAAFDRGRAVVVLRGGLLSCVDARLIGDDLSLLGNGTVLADGRCAAAVRLVAPPDVASAVAARAFPGADPPPSLTRLSTSQRSAFDIELSGDVRHVFLKAGADGPVVEFHPFTPP